MRSDAIGDSQFGFLASFGINYRIKGFELDVVLLAYNTINYKNTPLFVAAGYLFNIKSNFCDTKRTHFYIYTQNFDNLQDAQAESKRLHSQGFSSAWILIVK